MEPVRIEPMDVEATRRALRVQGYVRHLITGAGVGSAKVTLADASDRLIASAETFTNHGRAGFYAITLDDWDAGIHTINVVKPGFNRASRRFEVAEGGEYDISFSVV